MPSTIRDLTELTAVASDDYVLISDTSDVTNRDKRISQTNLLGSSMLRTFSGGVNLVAPTAILNVGDPAATDTINASASNVAVGVNRYIANTGGPSLILRKSRHATIGSHTIVQSGDDLGRIFFYGSNGASFDLGGAIIARVDGTPGTGDMPTRLEFQTSTDGSATPTTVLTLGANNLATFAGGINLGQATLSYFDQGSWTPTLSFGGLTTGIAGTFTGRFVRMNNWVQIWGGIQLSNKGSATGNVSIGGLPFTTVAIAGIRYVISVYANGITYVGMLEARLSTAGASSFTLEQLTEAGAITTLTNTNFSNTSNLEFNFAYLIT